MRSFAPRFLPVAALALVFTACASPLPKRDPALTGPYFAPANVRGVAQLPLSVRRIALLPAAAADPLINEDTLRALDRIFANTLTRSARAEITPVPREVYLRLTGRDHLLSTAVLPADFMARLTAETGADALMFVDVTTASPYPPLVLGLRARLVDATTGDALWTFDNVFSTTDPAVVNSARAHGLRRTSASATPGNLTYTVLQNPLSFADYASSATWATLPPR